MKSKYDIVIATDANYIIHALTLMASVGANEKETTCFHILSFNMTSNDKEKFKIIPFNFPNISYCFYDLTDDILKERLFSGVEVSRDRSLATYARLLIPELLPKEISRCVYMDVDAIVYEKLDNFYKFDFNDYLIAGVRDTNPINRQQKVGLHKGGIYINAGMIVWNLEACRQKDVVGMFRQFIKERNGVIDAMDQGTINGTLSKYILPLSPRFNVLTSYFQMDKAEIQKYYKVETYSNEEILKARNNPIFVHFTPNLTTRPWVEHCKHPLVGEYWKYRKLISTTGMRTKDNRTLKQKMLSRLFYFNHSCYFALIRLFCK